MQNISLIVRSILILKVKKISDLNLNLKFTIIRMALNYISMRESWFQRMNWKRWEPWYHLTQPKTGNIMPIWWKNLFRLAQMEASKRNKKLLLRLRETSTSFVLWLWFLKFLYSHWRKQLMAADMLSVLVLEDDNIHISEDLVKFFLDSLVSTHIELRRVRYPTNYQQHSHFSLYAKNM